MDTPFFSVGTFIIVMWMIPFIYANFPGLRIDILYICGGMGLHLSWVTSTRTHSCQAFDECSHYTKQMHWLLFCTSQYAHHQLCHNQELPTLVSTSSLGLQLHLPQFTSPCKHIPFCDVVQNGRGTKPASHTWSSVSPQMWQWPPPHAVCSGFFPRFCPSFSWTHFRIYLAQTVPVTILSTVRDLERLGMSKVGLSLSPRLFLLIPSPITPLLLLPTRKI